MTSAEMIAWKLHALRQRSEPVRTKGQSTLPISYTFQTIDNQEVKLALFLHCFDLSYKGVWVTYYAVARLSELDPLPNPCHFIGLRIEYKRQRVAV